MFLRRIGFGHLSNADNHRIYIVTEDALLPYIYFRLICAFFFVEALSWPFQRASHSRERIRRGGRCVCLISSPGSFPFQMRPTGTCGTDTTRLKLQMRLRGRRCFLCWNSFALEVREHFKVSLHTSFVRWGIYLIILIECNSRSSNIICIHNKIWGLIYMVER